MVEATTNSTSVQDNITVGVRVRPPLQRELEGRSFTDCCAVDGQRSRIFVSLEDRPIVMSQEGEVPEGVAAYTFDHCFNSESTQEKVYNATVRPSVDAVRQGYNATVFAYGQTGTGKTHTMQGTDADPGVAPRAVTQLFDSLRRRMAGDDAENNDDLVDSGSEEEKQEEPVEGAAQ